MAQQEGLNQGIHAISILIAGLLLYGGIGWVLDHWLGTRWWTPVGLIVGAGFGIYLVIVKFGRSNE